MKPVVERETPLPDAVRVAIETLAEHPAVVAITLGGSHASANGDHASDYDLEVFTDGELPVALRRSLATPFDSNPEIDNPWFGPADEWTDTKSGVAVDIAYFDRDWFETVIRDVIERHSPSLGYTTAFWHTLRHAQPAYERDAWLASMRDLAGTRYPEELRRNIVAWNHPVLRTVHSSYRHQIELALMRDDPVSVNHRVSALLASVFDIVFALARALHPGEKRLLDHVARLGDDAPERFEPLVRSLLRATGDPDGGDVLPAIDAVCDTVDASIQAANLHYMLRAPER
jgi:hypothetical protein